MFVLFEELFEFVSIFSILRNMVCEVDAVGAPLNPGSFRHGGIDLFQVKLALDALFVDVGDHVGWLDEGHGEGEAQLEVLACQHASFGKSEVDCGKLGADAAIRRKDLNNERSWLSASLEGYAVELGVRFREPCDLTLSLLRLFKEFKDDNAKQRDLLGVLLGYLAL